MLARRLESIGPAYMSLFGRSTGRRRARPIALILFLLVAGCGGGGGGGSDSNSPAPPSAPAAPTVDQLANVCTPAGEKTWVLAHLNDAYLFYRDLVAVDPNAYATPEAYFNALLVPAKDRFSFVEPQSVADAFFTAGQDVGYGGVFKYDAGGKLRIGFVDAGGPLALQGVARGAEVTSLQSIAVASLSTAAVNGYLFPTAVGVPLTLTVLDPGQTVARSVTVSSASVTEDPVPLVQVLSADPANPASPKVGYLLFNDQIATSEAKLVAAFASFRAAGVADLIVDLRYNGGGYLYIASQLAAMIGGNRVPAGSTFEKLSFNDKHPEKTNNPANTLPFFTATTGGQPLPTLNLPRVFVITAPGTCSASESVINGLTPFVQVVRIGGTTCGKPYGFVQTNNCGKAYFAIQFQGVNAVGFGDYANGFAPTCVVADDFDRALGDRAEGRLAATLAYQRSGTCPATATAREDLRSASILEGTLGRPERRNRLVR